MDGHTRKENEYKGIKKSRFSFCSFHFDWIYILLAHIKDYYIYNNREHKPKDISNFILHSNTIFYLLRNKGRSSICRTNYRPKRA